MKTLTQLLGLEKNAEITEILEHAEYKIAELEGEVSELRLKILKYEEELGILAENKAENLIEGALLQGKIIPAQKEFLLIFALNDYEACKSYIEMLPANPLFQKNTSAPNLKDPKFFNERGVRVTYAQILRNPKLIEKNKFTEAELEQMRSEHFR